MTTYRFWDGRTVHCIRGIPMQDRREVELSLTPDTAAHLAAILTLAGMTQELGDDLREIQDALDFVLKGDEASIEAHRRMKAGRGMTPDGGYREPDPVNRTLFADVPVYTPRERYLGVDVAPVTVEVPRVGEVTQSLGIVESRSFEETDAPEHEFEASGLDMTRCKVWAFRGDPETDSGHPCWKTKEEHPNA